MLRRLMDIISPIDRAEESWSDKGSGRHCTTCGTEAKEVQTGIVIKRMRCPDGSCHVGEAVVVRGRPSIAVSVGVGIVGFALWNSLLTISGGLIGMCSACIPLRRYYTDARLNKDSESIFFAQSSVKAWNSTLRARWSRSLQSSLLRRSRSHP